MVDRTEFDLISRATELAIERVLAKGTDDVFKPPMFSQSVESTVLAQRPDDFRTEARRQTVNFLKAADLKRDGIGPTRKGLVSKDHNSFRQVCWLDPFDAVKYLAASYMLFGEIEKARIPKSYLVVHSHRKADSDREIFDSNFGYDSFRRTSSEISQRMIGKWKVVTDISNFFDRIGNHSLENHLDSIGCTRKYVDLIKDMLFFWAGDRRGFGVPVGSDASRILAEAALIDVDRKMNESGATFIRYVDDFRIFCETKAKALKSIEILTELLAREGLSLNSRKTDIFQIIEPEEISEFTDRFTPGEHEKIDLEQRVEVKRAIRVSGRTSISKFYREPGKEALNKIRSLDKKEIMDNFKNSLDNDIENNLKLIIKYFIYADQDVNILSTAIKVRISSIFYISDALVKEHTRFDFDKRTEIKTEILNSVDWLDCAYPLQVPVLRIVGHPSFPSPHFVHAIIDSHLQADCLLFYREVIALGHQCLDRSRIRHLAIEIYPNVPNFVKRTIYHAVLNYENMPSDQKNPLLKNMKNYEKDWFITRIE